MSTNVSAECLFGFGNLDENSEAEGGVPLPLAQAGNHRIKCQHSRSMQRLLELISWSRNPYKSLIIKALSPAWLSNWGLLRKLLTLKDL